MNCRFIVILLAFLYTGILASDESVPEAESGVLMTSIRFEGNKTLIKRIILTNIKTDNEITLRLANGKGFLRSDSIFAVVNEQREGLVLQEMPAGSYYLSHIDSYSSNPDNLYARVPTIRKHGRKETIDILPGKITYIGDLTVTFEEVLQNTKVALQYQGNPETIRKAVKEYRDSFIAKDLVFFLPGMDEPVPILRSALDL